MSLASAGHVHRLAVAAILGKLLAGADLAAVAAYSPMSCRMGVIDRPYLVMW